MSNTRDILIDAHGPIERVAGEINGALDPDTPLTIQMVRSPRGSWKIAEGVVGSYPLVLVDTSHLDAQASRGFGWNLEVHCQIRPGEEYPSFTARCDADARGMMKKIGTSLRTRCVVLSNLQGVLGQYP